MITCKVGRTVAALPPVTAAGVRAARFGKRMRGYAPGEVDEALNAAVAELERQVVIAAAGTAAWP